MKLFCIVKGSNFEVVEIEGGCFRFLFFLSFCISDRALFRRNETLFKWSWSLSLEGISGYYWVILGFSRFYLVLLVFIRLY